MCRRSPGLRLSGGGDRSPPPADRIRSCSALTCGDFRSAAGDCFGRSCWWLAQGEHDPGEPLLADAVVGRTDGPADGVTVGVSSSRRAAARVRPARRGQPWAFDRCGGGRVSGRRSRLGRFPPVERRLLVAARRLGVCVGGAVPWLGAVTWARMRAFWKATARASSRRVLTAPFSLSITIVSVVGGGQVAEKVGLLDQGGRQRSLLDREPLRQGRLVEILNGVEVGEVGHVAGQPGRWRRELGRQILDCERCGMCSGVA